MEIGFYHLTRTPVEDALPALLGRTLDAGERALVRCPDEAMVTALDKALWACREPVWLPHGTAKLGHEARQPIWLTSRDECPNGARFLFRIDGAGFAAAGDGTVDGAFSDAFTRVFDLFNGQDDVAVQQARLRWKALKSAGHALVYWRQEARGWAKAG